MTSPRLLTLEAVKAINAPETAENFLWLLTITHDDLASPKRLVRGYRPVASRGNTYTPFPFTPQVAQQEPDRPPTLSISIGNVSRDITAALETLEGTPKITLEVVLASHPWQVEFVLQDFEMRGAAYNKLSIRAELTAEDYWTAPCPYIRFTPTIAPGSHRS